MESGEIRKRFLEFFEKRGHAIIPSALLVPENDPTTLFTGSGMQPLLPYLLGEAHPRGTRLANSQKCFRAQDIEEVGDNRHTTFFEMLGNWSLGDYWKEEQLSYFFEFLTREVGLPRNRLWVTCFDGDERLGLPRDTESAAIWRKLGVPEERIRFYGATKNWWSRSGEPQAMPSGEPGGPDSEVFFEFVDIAHDAAFGEECHPNCDCGRFMEIGNSVFMEYVKQEDGTFKLLPRRNVDFGAGLERITAASNDNPDVFLIDIFRAPFDAVRKGLRADGDVYAVVGGSDWQRAIRIVLDHLRAAMFLTADGVVAGPKDRGFVARTLLKRLFLNARKLTLEREVLSEMVRAFTLSYDAVYPALRAHAADIEAVLDAEEKRVSRLLAVGFDELKKKSVVTPKDIFDLYQSKGLDLEYARALAGELNFSVNWNEVENYVLAHRQLSRSGSEKKFKGGLAGHSNKEVRYHTATHLLHQALRTVLGGTVFQKGSNITPERLRFDFSFGRKMTDEEKKRVQDLVNQKIRESLPVSWKEMTVAEAKKRGAIGLFEEQYGDVVKVYQIGDGDADIFSLEFCGGPHVKNTSELKGVFKILKEEAVSAGVRRIKAVLDETVPL